jgi:hypothetical protein
MAVTLREERAALSRLVGQVPSAIFTRAGIVVAVADADAGAVPRRVD